jgi:hypothetical protein
MVAALLTGAPLRGGADPRQDGDCEGVVAWVAEQAAMSQARPEYLPSGTYVFSREDEGTVLREGVAGADAVAGDSRAYLVRWISPKRFELRSTTDIHGWESLGGEDYLPSNEREHWCAILPLEVHWFDYSQGLISQIRIDRLPEGRDPNTHPRSHYWRVPIALLAGFVKISDQQPGMAGATTFTECRSVGLAESWLAYAPQTAPERFASSVTLVRADGQWRPTGHLLVSLVTDSQSQRESRSWLKVSTVEYRGHFELAPGVPAVRERVVHRRDYILDGPTERASVRSAIEEVSRDSSSARARLLIEQYAAISPDAESTTTLTLVDYDPTPLALKDIGMRHDPRIATPAPVEYHDRNEEWNQRTPAPDYRRNPR